MRFTISPEPTDDERDAVVAALTVLLLAEESAQVTRPTPLARWTRTGRLEAMRDLDRRADQGWGRARQ
jgi:hypothetical protein